MKTQLNNFNNTWYRPGSSLKILFWYLINTFFVNTYWFPFSSIKVVMLRSFGASIGKNVLIKPGVNIKYPWLLTVGENVWIGEGTWIDNLAQVTIADNVCISQGAMLLCGNHNYTKSTFDLMVGEITLDAGVWIGAQSVVCPNVRCHSHAVLSVQSVATKDLEEYTIYSGNPAKAIRKRIITE